MEAPVLYTLRRSRTTPIDALCPELIIMVFKLLLHSKQVKYWVSFIHVCRRWRTIPLSYPSLWKDIAPISVGHLSFMLDHSRPLPVTISPLRIIRDQASQTSQIESLVDQHIARIRELDLFLDPSSDAQIDLWVDKLFDPTQASSLETLTFEVLPFDNTSYLVALPVQANIVVRSLKLINIRINIPRDYIQSNITSFHFDTDDCTPTLPKTAWLLRILSCLPKLVHLHLRDDAFDAADLTGSIISLLELQSFTFSGSAAGYLFLSQFLRIPTNTRLLLSLGYVDDMADEVVGRLYDHLSIHLLRRWESRSEVYDVVYSIRNVSPTGGSPHLHHTLQVISATPPPVPTPLARNDPVLDLKLVCVHKYELRPGIQAYRYMSLLTAHLSDNCIMALHLSSNILCLEAGGQDTKVVGDDGVVLDDFRFLTWSGLRYLALHNRSAAEWIAPYLALHPVFPCLQYLVVDGLNPPHEDDSPDPVEAALTVKETLMNIRAAIVARAVDGTRKLKTVTFTRSGVPPSWRDADISASWASVGVRFDDNDWDVYWAEPFETVGTLEEYYAEVFEESSTESLVSAYSVTENDAGDVEVQVNDL